MAVRESQPFRLRSLTLFVYFPTFLFAVGQGAVIPVIPLVAKDLAGSVALAGIVVSLRGFGTMGFDVPAGLMVSRFGERGAMLIATVALAIVATGAALSPSIWLFAGFIFVMGCAWAIWLIARLSYVTDLAPVEIRGRALSLLGGANRVGNFAGPFLGGFAAAGFGLSAAFYVQAVLAVGAFSVLALVATGEDTRPEVPDGAIYQRLGRVVRDHRRVFLTAGLSATAIGVLRAARQAVIPLWGDEIGLGPGEIGIIFGLSSALDMTLFYPVGVVMDRWGRKWAGVPCLLVMAAGLMAIPLASDFVTLTLVGLVTGFGNGLGSGIVMTLGADFSPTVGRGEFLGVWRLVGDLGTAGGPAVVGVVAGVASLGAASVATGGLGLIGAGIMAFFMAEPLNRNAGRSPP